MSDSRPNPADNPAEPAFWAQRWQTGETRWDLGRAYPGIVELLDKARAAGMLPLGARILEPGAGRAHTGAALAGMGYLVTSFDVVPEAIAKARELYGQVNGLTLEVADALTPRAAWLGAFDGMFDRAMLCALPLHRRREYAEVAYQHLAPGGVFLSAVVMERRENPDGGPPFAVSQAALDEMLSPRFECLYRRVVDLPPVADSKVAKELLSVWRRRPSST